MRISTNQLFTESTRNMVDGQSRLADIQNKISSGKNFQSLAEDPVGANQVVNLKRELNQLEMYQRNIDSTRRNLSLEDSTLADINNGLFRARELVIQAGNGTLSDVERRGISYEIDEIVEYLAGLMNTRDSKGEFLFSGSKGTTQSFQKQLDGSYLYAGDSSQRQIQVASSQYVESSDSGQFLFQSVVAQTGVTVLGPNTDALVSSLRTAEISINDPAAYEAAFRASGNLTLSVANVGAGPELTLTDSAGNALPTTDYYFDSDNNQLVVPGAILPLEALVDGTSATLRFSQTEGNILNTLVANVSALRTLSSADATQSQQLTENLALTLEQISAVEERLGEAVATVGARLNVIDASELSNDEFALLTQSTLSSVEDLDYASASTELAKRQLALEASFASFARIQGLSLFNYID